MKEDMRALGAGETQLAWLEQMHAHTTVGGKMNRGLAAVETLAALRPGSGADASALALGWAVEWLQASFLIADDIMDRSATRRGRPCWYRLAGAVAINDAFVLQSMAQRLLRKHFAPGVYSRIADLFGEVRLQTELGQLLDLLTAPTMNGPGDSTGLSALSGAHNTDTAQNSAAHALLRAQSAEEVVRRFTPETYAQIVRMKTAHYSFRLPVVAAAIASGVAVKESTLKEAEDVLLELGDFFQIQDDFLDCYGDARVTGKVGTDIAEGKCTWLATQALSLMDGDRKAEFAALYLSGDAAGVKRVYDDLGLPERFAGLERGVCDSITLRIASLEDSALSGVLSSFASRIFGRAR